MSSMQKWEMKQKKKEICISATEMQPCLLIMKLLQNKTEIRVDITSQVREWAHGTMITKMTQEQTWVDSLRITFMSGILHKDFFSTLSTA